MHRIVLFFVMLFVASFAIAEAPNLDREFTIACWVKTEHDGSVVAVTAKRGEWRAGDKCLFLCAGCLNFDIGWVGCLKADAVVADGKWHHLALTGPGTYCIYVDGKQVLRRAMDNKPSSRNSQFNIGQCANNFPENQQENLNGLVDDLRIYDRILLPAQIAQLFAGKAIGEGLVAHLPLDSDAKDRAAKIRGFEAIALGKFTGEGKIKGALALDGRIEPKRTAARRRPAAPSNAGVYHGEREMAAKAKFAKTGQLPYRYLDTGSRPEFGFDRLLFVKRQTYHSSHFYTDFIDGCSRYGGNISILDLKTGHVTNLFAEDDSMATGIFGRICLSFDAKKLLFDWKKAPKEGFRIYEVKVDGTGLRQLTFPPKDEAARIARYDNSAQGGTARMYYHQTDDMHPCYLPDGGILFTSTRCEYGTLCDAPDNLTTPVLHRIEADGSDLRPLTNSAVSEFSPTVTEDGWILYTRWEYVDKGQLGIKCLWAMKPDGTATKEVYGNDIQFPPTMLHGRQIPDDPHKFVMLGTPHYPQSGIGTVISVDTTKPIRTTEPMKYITWWVDIRQEPGWNQFVGDGWKRHTNGPLYMDPFPLNERQFLVAHNRTSGWSDPTAYGLYLIDDDGNHWPILDDDSISLWQPTPLVPTRRPPVLPRTTDPELAKKSLAVCMVQDIYHGMEGIERGEVKWIRILEQIPRPWACRRTWSGDASHTSLVSRNTSLATKALYGVVPVDEDGSAHFYVPADRNIYFEAIDENFMELQRERTYVNYKPGERRACIGCHETPNNTPLEHLKPATALSRLPIHAQPQPGDSGPRPLHYITDVQPVLDEYCISCHGEKSPAAGLRLTGELTQNFNQSYEAILSKRLVTTTDEASDWGGSAYLPTKRVGSHASRFSLKVLEGCTGMKEPVPMEAKIKLFTWVDANAIYYGSYWGRRHLNWKNHPNFRPVPTFEDAISTECPIPWDDR